MIYKDRSLVLFIMYSITILFLVIQNIIPYWVFLLLIFEAIITSALIPSQEEILEYDRKQRSKRK